MVQVDIFWSYGIGASFAAASSRQLMALGSGKPNPDPDPGRITPFVSKYFITTILFLACFFAPSGIYLLWHFPHWETMQVATCHEDIPAWLVIIFAITGVTQGVLGYWVTNKFIQKGNIHAAGLQFILGHFCMFFILLYGWDGLGWQRFLYDATVTGALWKPGQYMTLDFFTSNIFITLMVMGAIMIPLWMYFIVKWIKEGAKADPSFPKEKRSFSLMTYVRIILTSFFSVFGVALVSAAIAALMVHYIGILTTPLVGYLIGLPLFLLVGYFTVYKKGCHLLIIMILGADPQK